MDDYGLFRMSLNDMKAERITTEYQYCLNQYKGMLIVVDKENKVYQISTDFTKKKSLGTEYGNHVIGNELYCTNFKNDTMISYELSDNTGDFEELTLPYVENDIDKINTTDYQVPIEEDGQNLSVGPYIAKINEDGKTLTIFSAFLNSYKAICPDSLTLPSSLKFNGQEYPVTAIGEGFFMEANVTELIVPEGILTLGDEFCVGCVNLEIVSLPSSLTRIGYPFIGMWELDDTFKEIKIAEGNRSFKMIDGAMYSYDGETLIRAPFAAGEYHVESGVKSIAAGCFYENSKITKVIVPDGVTYIGPYAFFECEKMLEEVVLPDSVSYIGTKAFGFCIKLRAVNLPKNITTIAFGCFMHTALREVIIPEGVKRIEGVAFYHCYQMETLSLPSTLMKINSTAFQFVDGGLLSKDGTVFYLLLTSDIFRRDLRALGNMHL